MIYDIAILGLGPAGLTAAIYAKRYNLNVIAIGKKLGGLASEAAWIENYPGFESVSGMELANKMLQQAKKLGTEILTKEIVNLEKKNSIFIIQTNDNKKIEAKSVVFALGTEKKKLNISDEDKFLGKGVSYCSVCDSSFFKDKNVAVIGGNDSAAHAALLLAEKSKKVFIIYRKEQIRCEKILFEKVKGNKKIEIICNSLPLKIEGDSKVKSIIIDNNGKKENISVDGIFVEIGSVPLTSLAKKLNIGCSDDGYIKVNDKMETNVQGIYAAGDITITPLRQVIVAAAQGAIAASSAYNYVRNAKNF